MNISNGFRIGGWRCGKASDDCRLSPFSCWEFLEAMATDSQIREEPWRWATELLSK